MPKSHVDGTDLYYAEMDYEGYMPDLGSRRISVDTTGGGTDGCQQIISYEGDRPGKMTFTRESCLLPI